MNNAFSLIPHLLQFTNGCYEKNVHLFLKIENGANSDFRNYLKYSKTKHTEILELIVLRNHTKINIVFQYNFSVTAKTT